MTYEEKLVFYATAAKASAGQITQIVDGNFVNSWVGKLRGKFVGSKDGYKHSCRSDAAAYARSFRESCRKQAIEKGLLPPEQEHIRSKSSSAGGE